MFFVFEKQKAREIQFENALRICVYLFNSNRYYTRTSSSYVVHTHRTPYTSHPYGVDGGHMQPHILQRPLAALPSY